MLPTPESIRNAKIRAGRDLLENIDDSLPAAIQSTEDAWEMLRVLIDHTTALAKALYGYDVINEAADAIDALDAIDEGEYTDSDRLREIARILRGQEQ